MPIIVPRERIRIGRNGSGGMSTRVPISALTSKIRLTIARELPGNGIVFPDGSRLDVRLIVRSGVQDFYLQGQTTGGVRLGDFDGLYACEYSLPTGFFSGDTVLRLGEAYSGAFDLAAEISLTGGRIDTFWSLETFEEVKPDYVLHHSVAFDAASGANESNGDGVLTLSHTASGTDRAAFISAACLEIGPTPPTSGACTYDGNSATEQLDSTQTGDINSGRHFNNAINTIAGDSNIPTTAATVSHTFSVDLNRHHLGVVTMNGVDGTTPVGSLSSEDQTTTNPSVTVSGTVTDGMCVDSLMIGDDTNPCPNGTPGADQTSRVDQTNNGFTRLEISTQSSNDGGVMSWTASGDEAISLAAIEFKPAAAAGGPKLLTLLGVG